MKKHPNFFKVMAPIIAAAALLLSSSATGMANRASVENLINACQQELQTLCARLDEPREAVICLRENEPQLFTRQCITQMRLMNQERNNYPLPTEEPFRTPNEEGEVR